MDHPFHLGAEGGVATTDAEEHVRNLIQQVLFTRPGERVNRPDFGCGLARLVFMPNSDILATATHFMVRGSLQRWLGDVIRVERVSVSNEDERLIVRVDYVLRATGRIHHDVFPAPGRGGSLGGVP